MSSAVVDRKGPPRRTKVRTNRHAVLFSPTWGSRSNRRHVMLGMTAIISSTGSCQVLCVSLDTAMVLRVITPHDLEGPEASSHARHERELLSIEDEKDQK